MRPAAEQRSASRTHRTRHRVPTRSLGSCVQGIDDDSWSFSSWRVGDLLKSHGDAGWSPNLFRVQRRRCNSSTQSPGPGRVKVWLDWLATALLVLVSSQARLSRNLDPVDAQ